MKTTIEYRGYKIDVTGKGSKWTADIYEPLYIEGQIIHSEEFLNSEEAVRLSKQWIDNKRLREK